MLTVQHRRLKVVTQRGQNVSSAHSERNKPGSDCVCQPWQEAVVPTANLTGENSERSGNRSSALRKVIHLFSFSHLII